MYQSYWGLNEKPFQNTCDPRFLCLSEQHEEALSRLKYVVEEHLGCALLTGVFGSGKTLLAQALIDYLKPDQYVTAFIFNPQFSNVELLQEIVYQLGVHQGVSDRKTDILHRMTEILNDNNAEGRHVVILVDEAHLIEDRAIFEELRLLLNFQNREKFLLTLILIGQPDLREKISQLKPFDQRVSMRFHLKGLRPEETEHYIQHRLQVAGANRVIFTPQAARAVHDSSGGLPRRINQICDLALLAGYGLKVHEIHPELISDVLLDPQVVS